MNSTRKYNVRLSLLYFLSALVLVTGCSNSELDADAYGNFEATEIVVSSEVGGTLLRWDVHEGLELDANQIVGLSDTTTFSLQCDQLQSQMDVVRTKSSTIDAQAAVVQAQLDVAKNDQNRINSMFEDGAATQKQLDDINGQISVYRRQLQAIQVQKSSITAELSALKSQISLIEDQIRRATIRNPIQGIVLANYIEFGEMAAPGKPLYRIANLNDMTLRAFVDAHQLADLSIGQSVVVRTDASDGGFKSVDGTVTWISPRAEFTPRTIQTRDDRVTLVYAIKIRVPNDGTIKIGMPGDVSFTRTNP